MDRSAELANLILNVIIVLALPAWRRIIFPPLSIAADCTASSHRQRFEIFDVSKGVAILAVILIHVAGLLSEYYPKSPPQILYFLDNLSRFAIPVFVISSGLLLNPESPLKDSLFQFFGRKLLRSFLPYVICTIVILVYWSSSFAEILFSLLTGKAAPPYYFMVVLFQLYLLFPFLTHLQKNRWFLPIAFLISLFVFISGIGWQVASIPLAFRYLFFFALGMRLRNTLMTGAVERRNVISASFMGLLFILTSLVFQGLYSNVQLTFGPAVFVLLCSLRSPLDKGNRLLKALAYTGRISLWIFLLHFALVKLIVVTLAEKHVPFYPALLITLLLSPLLSVPIAALAARLYSQLPKIIR